jgi:hypothetical protein
MALLSECRPWTTSSLLFHDFDGDIPIPAIPVSAQPPSDESTSDPSAGASTSALKTRASKWKVTANPIPQKKARKTMGKHAGKIKINEPAPNAPALTPPSGPQKIRRG